MNEKEAKKTAWNALRSGRLNGTWTRDDLSAILREIGSFFSWKERKGRVYLIGWLSLFASVILLIVSINGVSHDVLWLLLFFVSLAGIAGSVTMLVLSIRKSIRLFVNSYDNFTRFSKPLLDMLSEDIGEGSSLEVDLALNDVENLKYLKETSDPYTKEKYFNCRDRFSEMPFIVARATLHDGNKLVLSVMDYCKRTEMTKKSPKGRNKTKYRYRLDTRSSVRLRVNTGNYRCKKVTSKGKEGEGDVIALKEADGVPVLTLVSNERIMATSLNEVGHRDPMPLYQKIASLYSHLEQAQGAR